MSCQPCDACGKGCGKTVTPEGLLCRRCADELARCIRGP